jgi:hypothetical protein
MNQNKEMFQGWYTMFKRERETIDIEDRKILLLIRRMDSLVERILDGDDPHLLSTKKELFNEQVSIFLHAMFPMGPTKVNSIKIDASVSLNMALKAWEGWCVNRNSITF